MLYNFINIIFWNRQKYSSQEKNKWLQRIDNMEELIQMNALGAATFLYLVYYGSLKKSTYAVIYNNPTIK